jgi:cobyric acid synthase
MIALTVIVCGGLLLAGVVAVLHAAIHAPRGYETEQGFFKGIELQHQVTLVTGDARLVSAADGSPLSQADGLGSHEEVAPWPQKGPGAAEPVLSIHCAFPHGHDLR